MMMKMAMALLCGSLPLIASTESNGLPNPVPPFGPEKSASAPAPVAGIDFWARDVTDVLGSSTRNLMPNPSFEQGLRYWAWWGAGGPVFVPSDTPAYSLSTDAQFGRQSLLARDEQGGQPLQSMSIPIVKGKTYTVSFYAKAEKPDASLVFGVQSPVRGSALTWMTALATRHSIPTTWERKSFSFVADSNAIALMIKASSPVLIDGIQLEEGSEPTEFIAPAIEGVLKTSNPDNGLAVGQPIQAVFELFGKPGTRGELALTVVDYYRETRFAAKFPFTLNDQGVGEIKLPFDDAKFGTGIFVVKAEYALEGGVALRDYYRFSIMDFLENKHATKDIFGNLNGMHNSTRGDDLARNYMRWGWGSTTYVGSRQFDADTAAKYRIANYLMIISDNVTDAQRPLIEAANHEWTEVTPEREKQIEDLSYEVAKSRPWATSWAFATESEGRTPLLIQGRFDEWAKIQLAAARGIKRANPDAKLLADGGTSGFSRLRGQKETEGYLIATNGKIKWDALATHPYGTLDSVRGWGDLDVETQNLIDLGKRQGYGDETPIDYTEGFNLNDLFLPEWGLSQNGDNYDVYNSGRPTYDSGWREYLQAAWAARTYLICLKYWPRVRSFNIWASHPFIDVYLTPLLLCKVPNTLGHLLGNPKFVADIKPSAGVRGYVFEDEEGRGVAALWCTVDKVEEGLERGPVMEVKFSGKQPTFIDLMGNERTVKPAAHDLISIPLSSAPLFLRSEKGGAKQLAADLNQAEIIGAGTSLQVVIQPAVDGSLEAVLTNLTNRHLEGNLLVASEKIPFSLEPQKNATLAIPGSKDATPGKVFSWKQAVDIEFANGKKEAVNWDLAYFYVPHVATPLPVDPASQQWDAIPSIPLTNWHVNEVEPGQPAIQAGAPGDLDAKFQMAWDKDNLYLRLSATDDQFVLSEAAKWRDKMLYMHDGCAEVYFDTGANGRSNSLKGFDLDDYRYDFSLGNPDGTSGPGKVYRFAEAYHQLAGGLQMPTKEEAAKEIQCRFERTANGYAYVMIFPQRELEPLHLEKGFRAGFGLFIHDKDNPKNDYPNKGLSFATVPGAHCDRRPDLWPIMVLKD